MHSRRCELWSALECWCHSSGKLCKDVSPKDGDVSAVCRSFFYPALFVKVGAAEYKEEEATKGEHKTAHILNANQATVWMSINQLWDELPQWPDRPKLASGFESELMRQVPRGYAFN